LKSPLLLVGRKTGRGDHAANAAMIEEQFIVCRMRLMAGAQGMLPNRRPIGQGVACVAGFLRCSGFAIMARVER
jgi:hypothetical protein